MKKIILIICIAIFPLSIFAQFSPIVTNQGNDADPYTHSRYGVWLHYNINFHRADYLAQEIKVESCCDGFENANGSGFSFGLLYEMPLVTDLLLGIRAGYFMNGAKLVAKEPITSGLYDYDHDTWIDGLFEHSLDLTINQIALEPMVNYRFWDQLAIHGGFHFSFANLSKEYSHKEKILKPATGVFETGTRERLLSKGDIQDISGIGFGLIAGLSYEFALDRNKNFLLAPEIFYHYSLTTQVPDVNWNIDNLRMGLAFKYCPFSPGKSKSILKGDIKASGLLPDGSLSESIVLKVEEFESTRMRPLLTYIFFDENSDKIPERYESLTAEQTSRFNIDKLHGYGVIETYRNILNIIGKRMLEHPEAKIAIEGCNSNQGAEKNNLTLSKNRAVAVRDYLQNVWGIPADRMLLSERNLPVEPSNVNDPDGIVENRRVEITSNLMDIIAPIITKDTLRLVNPPKVVFNPSYRSDAGLVNWLINAEQDGKTIQTFDGAGSPPEQIEWTFRREPNSIPKKDAMLKYNMILLDAENQTLTTDTKSLPVEQITISQKRRNRVADKYIDEYSLILFEFDKSKLSYYNTQIIDLIKSKMTLQSEVFISGHTDRIGNADYNKRLSAERAGVVAKSLPQVKNSTGFGSEEQLFDNNYPEGRFYCRRVDIRVETPVER